MAFHTKRIWETTNDEIKIKIIKMYSSAQFFDTRQLRERSRFNNLTHSALPTFLFCFFFFHKIGWFNTLNENRNQKHKRICFLASFSFTIYFRLRRKNNLNFHFSISVRCVWVYVHGHGQTGVLIFWFSCETSNAIEYTSSDGLPNRRIVRSFYALRMHSTLTQLVAAHLHWDFFSNFR